MAAVMSMALDGRDVHPFFIPKANPGHSAERRLDADNGHSKRRKAKVPDRVAASQDQTEIEGWAEQLKAAATGTSSTPSTAYISITDQGSGRRTRSFVRRSSNASSLSAESERQDGLSTTSPRLVNAHISVAEEAVQPAGSISNTYIAVTPPKKMLKIRSDGRLRSPNAKVPALDEKPKRGRKPIKAQILPETLVASIRYGIDAQSRSSMGCKIAAILSGTASNLSLTHSKPNRPHGPPKPTHPFFLGGSKRDQRHQEAVQPCDEKKICTGDPPATYRQEAIGPTKARVTSKPPEISERSIGMFRFGDSTSRSDLARASRFPGAMEPSWPSKGMVHVRQDHESTTTSLPTSQAFCASKARRKMKEVEVRIPTEEQILTQYIDVFKAYRSNDEIYRKVHLREWRELRRPLRRTLTSRELQQLIRQEIASDLPMPYHDATYRQVEDRVHTLQLPQSSLHPALRHMYEEIQNSLSAFDKFQRETQDWVHKFAPARADQVLQTGREVYILRDWLKTSTTNSVGFRVNETSVARDSSVSSRRATTLRKKRRAGELDGFVLSSDEEADEMCYVTDAEDRYPSNSTLKKSVIRSRDAGNSGNSERVTNAVVISGPHGCGKTAAVYAVARELGFEVFEINAGSRRSGRDLLDKVGDMSRNHLVKRAHPDQRADVNEEGDNMKLLSEKLKQDLDSGRQETMNSFFKSTRPPKKSPSKKKPKAQTSSPKQELQRKHQDQKQSFILLEEVDVLFEEDKTFWTTTLELLVQSKRPIIMTCTDESLLPLEDMTLHAILRFTYAPEQLATDYMLLVACNEGHILPRHAVNYLYKSKGFDLRASMTELNFFCQMAIGDTKGGLEWMLIPSPSTSLEKYQEPLRVVSEGTYQTGMGWLNGQHQTSLVERSINEETEMLSEAWYGWGIDIGAGETYISPSITREENSRTLAFQQLEDLDLVAETLSAADIFPGRLSLTPDAASVDPAQPKLTEKARSNYIEGFSLLQADPVVDQAGVTEAVVLTIRACARRLINPDDKESSDTQMSEGKVLSMIAENVEARSEKSSVRLDFASVFEPIARFNKGISSIAKCPQISTFDGSLSIIAEDLAPYVRTIVTYDLKLEEQRRRLNSLLAQPGRNSKRQRTTRASRAALEGGSKAYTRKERWFPSDTNFDLVLQSGGKGWQDIALKHAVAEQSEELVEPDDGPRRGSTGSVIESHR